MSICLAVKYSLDPLSVSLQFGIDDRLKVEHQIRGGSREESVAWLTVGGIPRRDAIFKGGTGELGGEQGTHVVASLAWGAGSYYCTDVLRTVVVVR